MFMQEAVIWKHRITILMKKVFALASLFAMAGGIAFSSLGLESSPAAPAQAEFETRKRMFAEQLRRDGASASPELLCTATHVSEKTSRVVYEAVLFGRSRVSEAAADAVSDDLVNTFIQRCRGNPNDLEPIIQQRGGTGLYQLFAASLALAGR